MLQKVSDFIKRNNLIEDGDRIVIGVSGGADSVSLLHVLFELYHSGPVKLIAVHINHCLRGEDAELDEAFVRSMCGQLGIDYYGFSIDVKKLSEKEGLSLEEAGRKARYKTFIEICNKYGCNKIAIAHNKNDNAETFLFNLFRGSGIKGLSGIDISRTEYTETGKITIIRPLLECKRAEIEAYLSANNYDYRTDMTNLSNDYSRNKLRNQVLPLVTAEINKNAIEHITGAAARLSEAGSFIDKCIDKSYKELVKEESGAFVFVTKELDKEDIVIKKGIILKIMEKLAGKRKDLETKHVEEVLALFDKQVGRQVCLPYGMTAERGYNTVKLFIRDMESLSAPGNSAFESPIPLDMPCRIYLGESRFLEAKVISYEKDEPIPKNCCKKWFDYDKIENAVELRTKKEGDYLQINSLGGNKKLKDYFIDSKIPKDKRSGMLLLADGSHVMWVLGEERISERYKVNENTSKILLINIINTEEEENGR